MERRCIKSAKGAANKEQHAHHITSNSVDMCHRNDWHILRLQGNSLHFANYAARWTHHRLRWLRAHKLKASTPRALCQGKHTEQTTEYGDLGPSGPPWARSQPQNWPSREASPVQIVVGTLYLKADRTIQRHRCDCKCNYKPFL